MSEHVMVKDHERRRLVCGKCGAPWPCGPKQQEILADIKEKEREHPQ
jgi:transcription initiation factor TFIIIB Brf1 subunit/transcription initiation factor TFIIB